MVEKIDCKTKTPTLFAIPELTLRQNDTLVLEFDQDIWDLNEAEQIMKAIFTYIILMFTNFLKMFKTILNHRHYESLPFSSL